MTMTSDPIRNPTSDSTDRYIAPDTVTERIFNPFVAFLVRRGMSMRGARILHVRGRTSGEWRTTPVNPLTLDGRRYLVAPRGTTQWVRNIRVSGEGRLQKGRRFEDIAVTEVDDADKNPVLRAYLREWGFEVGKFFEGITVDSTDADLAEIAPGFPVFRIVDRP